LQIPLGHFPRKFGSGSGVEYVTEYRSPSARKIAE
jgi:hypothetical protein